MRTITSHIVNPCNDTLVLEVLDEPGSGGANHHYCVRHKDGEAVSAHISAHIRFQNGPINEVGVNGLTHEVLLAILIDRMQGFQNGPYASRDNAVALTKMVEAQMWLHKRTLERMRRGVEGTHKV